MGLGHYRDDQFDRIFLVDDLVRENLDTRTQITVFSNFLDRRPLSAGTPIDNRRYKLLVDDLECPGLGCPRGSLLGGTLLERPP